MILDNLALAAWAADCEKDLNQLTQDLLHGALYASFSTEYESRFYDYTLDQIIKRDDAAYFQEVIEKGVTSTHLINVDMLPPALCLTLLCKVKKLSRHYTSLNHLVDAYAYLHAMQGGTVSKDALPLSLSKSVTSTCNTANRDMLKTYACQALSNLVYADDIALSDEVFDCIKKYLYAPPARKATTKSRRFFSLVGGIVAVCCVVYGAQHLPFVSIDSVSSNASSASNSAIQTYTANYKVLEGSVSFSTLFTSEESAVSTCVAITQAFWDEADFDLPIIDDSINTVTTNLLYAYAAPIDETLAAEEAVQEATEETAEETVQILDPSRIINYTPFDQDENIFLNEYGDVHFLENPQYEEINIYFGAAVGAIYDSYGRTIIVLDDSDCAHFFSAAQKQYGGDNITYLSGPELYYYRVIYNVSSVHYMNGYTFLQMNDGSWQRVDGSFVRYANGTNWIMNYTDYTLLDLNMIDNFISENVVKLIDGSYLCIDNQDGNFTFESFTVTEGRSVTAVYGDIAVLDDGSLYRYSIQVRCNTDSYQAYSELLESTLYTLMDENAKLDKIVRLCDAYYLISTQGGTLYYLDTETGALSLLTNNLDSLVLTTPQASAFVRTSIDWSTYAYAVCDGAYIPVHVYLQYILSEPDILYTLDDVVSFYNGGLLFASGITYPNVNDTDTMSYSGYVVDANGDLIAFDQLVS